MMVSPDWKKPICGEEMGVEWSSWKKSNVFSGCYTVLENSTVVLLV